MDRIHQLYEGLEKQQIMLCFKGGLNNELITALLSIIERKMDDLEEDSKTRKRVFNVVVECLQNLYHHAHNGNSVALDDPKAVTEKEGIVLIARQKDGYSVLTGNYIDHNAVGSLQGQLEKINSMDKEELHSLYRSILNNGTFSAKGGGGLGMVDIARKSKSKLEYAFVPGDGDDAFFSLNVNVKN